MPDKEKEYNDYLFDQLSAVERIEKQALTGDMEKVKEEIETLIVNDKRICPSL